MRKISKIRAAHIALTIGAVSVCSAVSVFSQGTPVTLSLVGSAELQKPMKVVIDAFEKKYPNIKVDMSFGDDASTVVRVGSGNPPDLFRVFPGNGSALSMVQLVNAGRLADLSDQSWVKRIPPPLAPVLKVDNKAYFFTPTQAVIGAVYNKQVFESLKLTVPRTWPQLLALCDTAKKAGVPAFALGAKDSWVGQLIDYALVPSLVYSGTPNFDELQATGKATFSNSGWKDALNKYKTMLESGCFNENPMGTGFEQQAKLVATGKTVAAVQLSLLVPRIQTDNPAATFGMFALPGADQASQLRVPVAPSSGLGVSAQSKNLTEARLFIAFMAQQTYINRYAELSGDLPIFSGGSIKINPVLTEMLPLIKAGKVNLFMDQRWPNADVQQAHLAGVQELLSGQASVSDVLKKMDDAYQKR
jgi:raffinose/stachyose/melibiose transport system substrate-binding protein